MFILNFLRFLKGYVEFTASGAFVERFINMAARARISLWGTRKRGETMVGYTSARDYARLHEAAKATDTVLQIQDRRGMPFILKKYRKRIGLLVGLVALLLFIVIMSRFIWSIEIVGNETVPTEEILAALEEEGLKTGVYAGGVDFSVVEQNTLIRLDPLAWLGISQDGTKIIVEVRERVAVPESIGKDDPCNVIAKKSGLIISLSVYDGKAEVAEGDTVMEGDMIANAIITNKAGSSSLNHARATAIAMIEENMTFEVPMEETVKDFTGEAQGKTKLQLFGLTIPIGFGSVDYESYDTASAKSQLNLLGMDVPLYVIQEQYEEYTWRQVSLTKDQAEAEALRMMEEYARANLAEAVILGKDYHGREENGKYILEVNFVYEEDIAVQQPLLVDGTLPGEAPQEAPPVEEEAPEAP